MNKPFQFLDCYSPLFGDKEYYLISGGRGSGKSYNVAGYFVLKLLSPTYFRGVITRYTQGSIKKSIYQDILDIIENYGMSHMVSISGDEISCLTNSNKIITHSMKLAAGNQNSRSKGLSSITHLLVDEFQELPSEEEYIKLVDSIRTPDVERKIFLLFNPSEKSHWIHKRWFIDGKPNPKWNDTHCFIHTTYKDNSKFDPRKAKEWDRASELDPVYYKYHILGEWKDCAEGKVYDNWQFHYQPDPESEEIYGLDFGFSSDPTALTKINKLKNRLWLKELIYETGMTNQDISDRLISLGIPKNAMIVADSAEPKSIEELKRMGWNIKPAQKGPDSIRSGIQRIRGMEVYVDPTSNNLIVEYQNYSWKPNTDRPKEGFDHLMDSIRYSLSLEKPKVERYSISGISRRN